MAQSWFKLPLITVPDSIAFPGGVLKPNLQIVASTDGDNTPSRYRLLITAHGRSIPLVAWSGMMTSTLQKDVEDGSA